MTNSISRALLIGIACVVLVSSSIAQSTAFEYQGTLSDAGTPADGTYDYEFRLFDHLTAGSQIGPVLMANGVEVASGLFSVTLDFGNEFPGADRWIEIRVRQSAASASTENLGGFTILAPRQKIRSVPYALRSTSASTADSAATADFASNAGNASTAKSAATADNALNLGGVAAAQYVVTTDPRLSDARAPTPGSPDYIQNSTVQQSFSDFNISGTGKAEVFDAGAQFDLNGARFIAYDSANENQLVGDEAGRDLTTGRFNLFVGPAAGRNTASGSENTFVGVFAGGSNVSGVRNTLIGYRAGSNTGGNDNTFVGTSIATPGSTSFSSMFGSLAGNETTGESNSFFGYHAGRKVRQGTSNSIFGRSAGEESAGSSNVFLGAAAGFRTNGSLNTFIGTEAGRLQVGGTNNTLLGARSFVLSDLEFATAIGANSEVRSSNTIVLGRPDGEDTVIVPGSLSVTGTIAGSLPSGDGSYVQNSTTLQSSSNFNISGTGKANRFDAADGFYIGFRIIHPTNGSSFVAGPLAGNTGSTGGFNVFVGDSSGSVNGSGASNSFVGGSAGRSNTTGSQNSFFGGNAGLRNSTGGGNSFFGFTAGSNNDAGSNNTLIGSFANVSSGNLSYATAIGAQATVSRSNIIVLGRRTGSDDVVLFGNLGIGTDSPDDKFDLSVNSGQITMGGGGCPSGTVVIGFNGALSGCNNYSIRGRNSTDLMLNRPTGGQVIFRENNGSAQLILHPGGEFEVRQLGSAGSTSLCRNGSNRISTCSSSILYKNNIEDFSYGLDILRRLRPVTFNWKDSGTLDLGLVAEEVAEIEPLLATYRDGVVEGVKYDRIGVVLVNVVKEQQKTIESLRDEVKSEKEKVKRQGEEIEELKKAVCEIAPGSAVCQ